MLASTEKLPRADGSSGASALDIPLACDLLQNVFEALPFGVSVTTQDGRRLLVNGTAAALNNRPDYGAGSTALAGDAASDRVVERLQQTIETGDGLYTLEVTRDITEQQRLEHELFDRAFLDDLTGLPNRALVEQSTHALIDGLAEGGIFALAFIDLDGFKHINDYYSHSVGDSLLVKIAQRLAGGLRPTDMVARVGGDEFVLLLTPVEDPAKLETEIGDLLDRLKQPFLIDGHEILASASIGVSIFPQHGRSYDLLRRNADSAMYRVKSGVKGTALLFEETMSHAATARMAVEQRLRLAVRDRAFCCVFQPKVDIHTREISGIEVLLRWRDEHGNIQAPGDFVMLAVELGLIDEIAHLVLADTVAAMDEIDEVFGSHVTISLNLAAKQAENLEFMYSFIDALAATGHAHRFMIELTEEAFFVKSGFQENVLPRLKALGVRVSIDDFGVGYSSLAALAEITVDEIKIDRSFITEIHKRPRSQTVLKAIESLAAALGMSVIAEGVETFEEVTYLQMATGIRYAQGYYFSRPMFLHQLASGGNDDQCDRFLPAGREVMAARADRVGSRTLFI